MTEAPFIIAIDGTAASGKGSLARVLAEKLGMAYLDTGLLYRMVGVEGLKRGIDIDDDRAATALAQELARNFTPALLENPDLRGEKAGPAASRSGFHPGVRDALFGLQRQFAAHPPPLADGKPAKGAVLDGRDIGTVICPRAPVKFYVTADTEIRAQRRHKELQSRGISVTYEAVLADMQERDARDSGRATAPLKPAADALVLDTSALSMEDVLARALEHVRKKAPARFWTHAKT